MRVRIDPVKCEGFGPCAEAAPELFQLDEWGYAAVTGDGTVPAHLMEKAQLATEVCPVRAITLTEEEG